MITPSFNLTATERVLPSLALDFTAASLDSRVTFGRTTNASNPATYIGSNGLITAATDNQPRFDYDPVTLVCKGLLIEESRQNLYIYSQDFNAASWVKSAATIGNDVAVSPDGTQNADKLIESATTAIHYMFRTMTPVSGTAYTFSVYAKAAERTVFRLNAGGGFVIQATFNLSTVTATLGAGTATSITPVGNDWYRCTVSGTATSNAAGQCQTILQTGTYAGDGTSGIFFWGAQLEVGAFATSYIPTTTTALTRNADVATMTGTNFSDWFNATEGTFQIQATPRVTNLNLGVVSVDDGSNTNRIQMFAESSGNVRGQIVAGGVVQAALDTGTTTANTPFKSVLAYKLNNTAAAVNGSATIQDLSCTIPTVNQMRIGSLVGANYLSGWVQAIRYWPMRLINNEVQAFSN